MGRATTFAIGLLLYAVAIPLHAATITVTNANDSGPGSLRQALANANNGDRINFAVTGTIMLTSGELLVNKNVTISGPGANQLSIDASNTFGAVCIFHVVSGEAVTISGLTITNGSTGIWNDEAIITVSNCVVSDISSTGLYNSVEQGSGGASITIANSLVSDSGNGIVNRSGTNQSGTNQSPPFGPTRTMARGSTLIHKPADDGSEAANCTACMTIAK
jgi:hypothetical protein